MGVLDQVTQMKSQGMNEEDIVQKLQDDGFNPGEIGEALDQEQIKRAVSDEVPQHPLSPEAPQASSQKTSRGPAIQEIENTYYPQETQSQEYQDPNQTQQEEDYSYSQGYSSGFDSSSMIEIAEQVFMEKTQKIQKQIENLSDFKAITESKINDMDERLKKIESIINNLQISILEKVGSYGQNIESIKKEMSMMQNSFGKIAGGLAKTSQVKVKQTKVFPMKKTPIKKTFFNSSRKVKKKR